MLLCAYFCDSTMPLALVQEVSNEFNFPETITSASFQLRKAYVALLWDYEQVMQSKYHLMQVAVLLCICICWDV